MAGPDPEAPFEGSAARGRILEAAYELFSRQGIGSVGVDTIVSEAGVAKMTLYRHFPSKADLALEFLALRERRWTNEWLREEVERRGGTPEERLLSVFDVFGEWFAREDFEGCSFITALVGLEDRDDPVRQASVGHLANIREFLAGLGSEAGIQDSDGLARKWHILMKGSIVAATEGDRKAAARSHDVGKLLLEAYKT